VPRCWAEVVILPLTRPGSAGHYWLVPRSWERLALCELPLCVIGPQLPCRTVRWMRVYLACVAICLVSVVVPFQYVMTTRSLRLVAGGVLMLACLAVCVRWFVIGISETLIAADREQLSPEECLASRQLWASACGARSSNASFFGFCLYRGWGLTLLLFGPLIVFSMSALKERPSMQAGLSYVSLVIILGVIVLLLHVIYRAHQREVVRVLQEGLCIRCYYPVGGSAAVCNECGYKLPSVPFLPAGGAL
jgi:hypothetical protein